MNSIISFLKRFAIISLFVNLVPFILLSIFFGILVCFVDVSFKDDAYISYLQTTMPLSFIMTIGTKIIDWYVEKNS